MTPIYEFYCYDCHERVERLRKMSDLRSPDCPNCERAMSHIVSAPSMHVWNTDRPFENVGHEAMSFRTKSDYERHLKEKNIAESSTDAPVKTPHGSTVTRF